ncbi:MAG: DUF3018 family protein [Thiotrichales bacterium]|nr:DUF3018 family protein [Thiotrichales bacterium]
MPASPAERMRAMRQRRRAQGDREVRMILPDARSDGVRAQIADSVARLDRRHESEALQWIETISEFDESEAR